jgi:large subunit ribosomal protein L17
MRHRKSRLQLNRFTSWRKATLISLARNLLIHESIKTTKIKAKAARPLVEKLISLGKKNTLAAKRQAFSILQDHKLVSLLFSDIATRFGNRIGGYIRILNLSARRGDNAKMVILELTEIRKKKPKKIKAETEKKPEHEPEIIKEEPLEEKKPRAAGPAVKEKSPIEKKPGKKFLGGLRGIFKKERDSL